MKSSSNRHRDSEGNGGAVRRAYRRHAAVLAVVTVALGGPARASADTACNAAACVAQTRSDAALLVSQLLELDRRAALQFEQNRLTRMAAAFEGGPTRPPSVSAGARQPSHNVVERMEIHAIYGVGSALVAELRINGNRVRYRGGARWPLDQARGSATYALIDMDHHCVRVRRRATVRRLCLRGEGTAP